MWREQGEHHERTLNTDHERVNDYHIGVIVSAAPHCDNSATHRGAGGQNSACPRAAMVLRKFCEKKAFLDTLSKPLKLFYGSVR